MQRLNDTELKVTGIEALNKALGSADAYRFMTLLHNEQTDYVKISRRLYQGQSIEDIFARKNQVGRVTSIRSNRISLPSEIVRRLGGKEVELIETREGVLLRPVGNIIKSTRGFLKGKGSFSSKKFISRKKEEKELE